MKSLLKFITCGSVDDGKSTLIGHILYDAKLLYADQKKALELDSKVGSREGKIDYSLLLDGLMAEREQGITIDVAYRYFTTDNRSFIVADTPGHEEYTRNMAVGASFADLAIILVDAKQGVLIQTRRHARICSLMGIKYFVFAVNKMDLIGYDKEKFDAISAEIDKLKEELKLANIKVIPVSATEGDNVTKKSENIKWYDGDTILGYLESVDVESIAEEGFYVPVQRVCRPNHTFRGFQGEIEAGEISTGDEVTIYPSGEKAIVKTILVTDREEKTAYKGEPVTIQLDREIDVSRGCIIAKGDFAAGNSITANILWTDDTSLKAGKDYFIKLGTKLITGVVNEIKYKTDVNTGEHIPTDSLTKNEIAVCDITVSEKIPVDVFTRHKALGELILIDRVTNMTSACGVVEKHWNDDNERYFFQYGDLRARGDIFEEYYYNIDEFNVGKSSPQVKTYTIGDAIPVKGESFEYPEFFDIVVLRDGIAVKVRDCVIESIAGLDEYAYSGVPVVNGRGFGIKIKNKADLKSFLEESKNEDSPEFYNKWLDFNAYRKIAFSDYVI